MIKVNNLSKEFHEQGTSNELLAVDHVDFTIQNGSFCALVRVVIQHFSKNTVISMVLGHPNSEITCIPPS